MNAKGMIDRPLEESRETRYPLRSRVLALGLLAVLTLAMFSSVLFTAKPIVLSNQNTDLFQQFIHWRAVGFGELGRGHLALWNPYVFSGTPFFGGFQSALLYPLNALFLVLPLDKAINWSIALHAFLAGAFTYAWAARRGLRPPACFLAGVIFMFCGANFLHIYAGHLSLLCVVTWAPLLFLAIDGSFEAPSLGWGLLGAFSLGMQILAGHPQDVFYTGVAAAIYCVLCLPKARERTRSAAGLAGIVLGGVALSAVQLLTSFQESHETLRSAGVPYEFAASYSFPPENFLTLLAPNFFGDMKEVSYWGRCAGWEMGLFISVSGLLLAVAGAVCSERGRRRFSVVMVVLLLLLALGGHTPLFKALYHFVPGFGQFRGSSKFTFLASLFLAMLAAVGCHELLKGRRLPAWLIWGAGGFGLVLLMGAVAVRLSSSSADASSWWASAMLAVRRTGEIYYVSTGVYAEPAFVLEAGRMAAQSLLISGVTLVAAALLLVCVHRWRLAVWILLGMAVVELFFFARRSLDTFDLGEAVDPVVQEYLAARPGDYRISNSGYPNSALSMGAQDVWGYDPGGIMLRYAQLLAFAQGADPDKAVFFSTLSPNHPLLGMVRCRFVFVPQDGQVAVHKHTDYLPHVLLVQRYRVLHKRNEIFLALTNTAFNPREEVVLESAPEPEPAISGEGGSASIADFSTDHLTIKAHLNTPGILLITDVYAKGWRARALPGSSQQRYRLMPANYCLRAIPLAAGEHQLRVEYLPTAFLVGRWVSLSALLVFAALTAKCWGQRPFASAGIVRKV